MTFGKSFVNMKSLPKAKMVIQILPKKKKTLAAKKIKLAYQNKQCFDLYVYET